MVAATLPRTAEQFRSIALSSMPPATGRAFRTLDIGGDKVLPYMRNVGRKTGAGLARHQARARLAGLLRSQIRACCVRRRARN